MEIWRYFFTKIPELLKQMRRKELHADTPAQATKRHLDDSNLWLQVKSGQVSGVKNAQ